MTQSKKKLGLAFPINQDVVKLFAIRSKALDVDCFRGFAKLADLARISNADTYDPTSNPDGLQRDLNRRHASEAYEYAKNTIVGEKRMWPEVILSLRSKEGVKIESRSSIKGIKDVCPIEIKIDLRKICIDDKNPTFSRVDGNHRLYFSKGDKSHPPLEVMAPFCIIENLDKDEEILIFRKINETQQKLNTHHLLRIDEQVSTDSELMQNKPVLWLVTELRDNQKSPFWGIVHIAGKKDKNQPVRIRQKSIYDGVRLLYKELDSSLKDENNLRVLPELLCRYYRAVANRWPNEWKDSKKYLLLTNTGMQALGIFGARLINDQAKKGALKESDFDERLKTLHFGWEPRKEGAKVATGRAGGEILANQLINLLEHKKIDLSKLLQ